MENKYKSLPNEAREFNKEFPTKKPKYSGSQIIIFLLIIALGISIGYILNQKQILIEKNESFSAGYDAAVYDQGFNSGAEYWNGIVITNWNERNDLVWSVNNTFQKLNIAQICGGSNDN